MTSLSAPRTRVRSLRVGKVTELTVVTPIRPECVRANPIMRIKDEIRTYRLRLEHSLLSLQQRIDDGIAIPPSLLGTIHFARWFILDDEPNDHAHPGRLVFTSNFDGDLEHYIRDFSTVIPDDIDAIWSNCSGYPEAGCRRFTEFWNYLLGHQVQCRTFVVDRPDLTVDDINQAIPRP